MEKKVTKKNRLSIIIRIDEEIYHKVQEIAENQNNSVNRTLTKIIKDFILAQKK